MVQRKVSNKLGIKTCHDKTDKSSANNMKPSSVFNYGGVKTSKGTHHDLQKKTTMIKKSRSFKRSESDILHLPSLKRNDPPAGKPSPPQSPSKVQSSLRSPSSSPNYMKSTTSSQVRKEQTTQLTAVKTPSSSRSSSPTTSKRLSFSASISTSSSHKLSSRSALTKTSSLKKFRTLTKSPSFKLSRSSSASASKVIFCSTFDVQKKATCSSTLKDSKFPPYLDLNPGGTESQGTSIAKVCPYTYCSLNGHHHKPSIPLRCFLASRRKMMKTQKSIKRKGLLVSSPRRAAAKNPASNKVEVQFEKVAAVRDHESPASAFGNGDGEEFFVEIYEKQKDEHDGDQPMVDEVGEETPKNDEEEAGHPEGGLANQNPDSMIDTENRIHIEEEVVSSPGPDTTSGLHDSAAPSDCSLEWDISTSITLEDFSAQSSDMEFWDDDDGLLLSGLDGMIDGSVSSESDRDYYDQAFGDDSARYDILFFKQEQCSEADDDDDICVKILEELCKDNQPLEHEHAIHHEEIMEQLSDLDSSCSDEMEMEIDDIAAQDCLSQDDGDNTGKDCQADQFTSIQNSENEAANLGPQEAGKDSPSVNQMEASEQLDDSEYVVETEISLLTNNLVNKWSRKRRSDGTEEQSNSSLKKLCLIDKSNEGPKQMETELVTESNAEEGSLELEVEKKESLDKTSYKRGMQENPNNCTTSKIKIIEGRRAAEEEKSNELKEFNPREPNFLPLEAEPDAEKVDLRHQEMEERKNSEEWMIDFALRKTVDKLAPARKKKVALLVEAFEKVMPAYRYEPFTAASVSSGFLSPGRLQACN